MREMYHIKKGHHREGLFPRIALHKGIVQQEGVVRFSPNCWYDDSGIYDYWNKLPGWTSDLLGCDSVRPAFRPVRNDRDRMWLGVYIHEGGVAIIQNDEGVQHYPIGKFIYWRITHSTYHGSVQAEFWTDTLNITKKEFHYGYHAKHGWLTGVYIGGEVGARRDMNLETHIIKTIYQ